MYEPQFPAISELIDRAIRPSLDKVLPMLRAIAPGQVIVYYRGDLAYDRRKRKAARELGDEAYELALAGKIVLLQVRIKASTFDYLALGTSKATGTETLKSPKQKRTVKQGQKKLSRPPFKHPDVN